MIEINENVIQIFDEVLQKISANIRSLMEELWINWTHLGVDEDNKIQNIMKLVEIENDFHKEVVSETGYRVKQLEENISKLKDETEELGRCLSVDITILEFKEDMVLIEYKKALEEQLSVYTIQAEQRRQKMDRLLEWQRDLVDKLGVTMHELQEEPLPAEEELVKLESHLEVLQAERDKRVELFLYTQVEIKDIMAKLQIEPQNKFEQMAVSSMSVDFKVTDQNMELLATLRQNLQEKYKKTNNRVLELLERLTRLWDDLEEDQLYRENFLRAHTGCHPETKMTIKEEINRCKHIKSQKIEIFVANVRTKIKLMWDNLMYSQAQREEFISYYQDIFTEENLKLHELYLQKITKFYEENKNIFELIETRKKLWLNMMELDARTSEPNRYQNRGGQLLQEEKERKAIENRLHKIEQQIREMTSNYEAIKGCVFTVDGKPLLQQIQDDWETRKTERQSKLWARKQAQARLTPTAPTLRSPAVTPLRSPTLTPLRSPTVTPLRSPTVTPLRSPAVTPLRSPAVTPLGKRDRTAARLAVVPDRRKTPSKRQLITGLATTATSGVTNNSAFKSSAVTAVKSRISGRLAAKALVETKTERVKRKLDYDVNKKTPLPKANGSILKHKRTSRSGRWSINANTPGGAVRADKNPLQDTTMLTSSSDIHEVIDESQSACSSMAEGETHDVNLTNLKIYEPCEGQSETPTKLRASAPFSPKADKENVQPPLSNAMLTPARLTLPAMKLNDDGFPTPRAPLSCSKTNLHRQNVGAHMPVKISTPNSVGRSKSEMNIIGTKNLPPM